MTSSTVKVLAGWMALAALLSLSFLPGRAAAAAAPRSCGSVLVQGTLIYKLKITDGSPSCATVRRIAKKYGHPTSKKPSFYCGTEAYECEYSHYSEGWRCGGLFQANFQCWHGANSPARADSSFEGSESRAR